MIMKKVVSINAKPKVRQVPLTKLVIYRGSVITWAEYIEIRDSF